MKGETIELPKLKRASKAYGGHVLYGAYEDSICSYHQFCAYTGDEKTRCHICHSNTHLTDDHGELPPGRTAPCLCSRCGELFTSVTGFSKHFGRGGRCRNPERRGLVMVSQVDRNGCKWVLWASPGSRPEDV